MVGVSCAIGILLARGQSLVCRAWIAPSGISCSSGGKRLGYAGSDSCDSFVGLTAIYNIY